MISNFFIDRPRFAVVLSLLMAVVGLLALFSLPVSQYPEIAPPTIRVTAVYPGASARVVADTVGAPLEKAVNGVEGMMYLSSSASDSGSYILTVTFELGTDPDMALVRVQNRMQLALPQLPAEVVARGLSASSMAMSPIAQLSLVSPGGTHSLLELNDYMKNNVKDAIDRIDGVGDTFLIGSGRSLRIWLNPDRIANLGLSPDDVVASIRSQNRQAALGAVGRAPDNEETPMAYSLEAKGRLVDVEDFRNVVVHTAPDGSRVTLGQIARIEVGAEGYGLEGYVNGAPSSSLKISQSAGSNAFDVMKAIRARIARLERDFPDDMEMDVVYDATAFVRASLKEIVATLALTCLLVAVVCYLFLQSWRTTLVPVAAIPVSVLFALAGLSVLGYSLNILTLFGFILVIGTVVDDAILVVERVQFIMKRDGTDSRSAAIRAMEDIATPMIATTLVFLAIFVPVAFMKGMTGIIYRQFAVTIALAVLSSLVVALTLSPVMCASLITDAVPAAGGPLAWLNRLLERTRSGYVRGAIRIARRSVATLSLFLLVVGVGWLLLGRLPLSFLPDEDQGCAFLVAQLPEGANRGRTAPLIERLCRQVEKIPGVRWVLGFPGNNFIGGFGTDEGVGSIWVTLKDWSERYAQEGQDLSSIMANLRGIAASVPEARVMVFTLPPIIGVSLSGGLDFRLQSHREFDPAELHRVLQEFQGRIARCPEALFSYSSYTAGVPRIRLYIDRAKAERLDVPVSSIFSTLQCYFGSYYVNDVNWEGQTNKVLLAADGPFRQSADSMGKIRVRSRSGAQVPLGSLAAVEKTLGPRGVDRYNLYPAAALTVGLRPGVSTGRGMALLEELAKTLPEGYGYEWSGMSFQEERTEKSGELSRVLLLALLFGYLFLVAQYESWTLPLSVLLSLATAFAGALAGIAVMKLSLSVYAQLGILLLVGLASKNAILIVEFARELRERRGMPILDAASQAVHERYRAVLMTALTCVFGILPMLFASGASSASRKAVGSVMVFGMTAATLLGLFLIPGLFVLLERISEGLAAMRGSRRRTDENEVNSTI